MRADEIVLLEVESVNHFSALGTLVPEIIRNAIAIFGLTLQLWSIEDAHCQAD